MKQSEIIQSLGAGNILAIGEYRGTIEDKMSWSTEGVAKSSMIRKHTVELGAKSVIVTEWPPKGMVEFPPNLPVPFKKGQKILINVNKYQERRGIGEMGGALHSLETV